MRRCLLASLLVVMCIGNGTAKQSANTAQQPASSAQQPTSSVQQSANPAQPPASPAPQPAVTFRAETNFVEVHAIVTDKSGAFVRDLTANDFEIYEDGRLQKTAVFSTVDLPIERPTIVAVSGEAVEPDIRTASRAFGGRIYIFLLDDLHTASTRSQLVRDTARQFIERYFGAGDLAAVVYTSGRTAAGQELTGSRRLLLDAIDRFAGRKLPSVGVEKMAMHLREAWAISDDNQSQSSIRTQENRERAEQTRDRDEPERALNARRTLSAVENVSKWMADVQGRRKALLLFSEGIDYDVYDPYNRDASSALVQDAQRAVGAAQRANVNIYGIDPRGLNGFGDLVDVGGRSDYPQLEFGRFRGFLHELRLSQESLLSLADQTGGFAIVNTGDVTGGLGRIVLDNSRYYLLGYYSDSKRWSKKFLKLDVRVKRPGVDVRARRGFLPPDTKLAKATVDAKAGTSPALAAALSRPVPVGNLPLRVFATPLKGSGDKATVLIAAELDGSALSFTPRDGRFAERVELSIVAVDENAKVQGGDRQQFDMNLMPETRDRVSRTGVRMMSRLDLPPGRYQIRVGAFETTGGMVATVPYDLEVPDYGKVPFAMSGLVLSSSDANALVNANPDPQLKDLVPATPVVSRSFTRAQTLTAFAEFYESAATLAHDVEIAATVRDARDGRTVFQARDRRTGITTGARAQGFTADIPLKDLAPGTYVLRVQATSSVGGQSAHRDVPFEVR
jgi:VWFA-related protein